MPGRLDRIKKGRGHGITARDEARILAATREPPPAPLTHWTTRRLVRPQRHAVALRGAGSPHGSRRRNDRCAAHSANFLTLLDKVIRTQPAEREIHIICDNLSAQKTNAVKAWLESHPQVSIHCTPTYSSWLNQVEIWFAMIQRELLDRGIFTSTTDLRRKIMSYIRLHSRNCRPFR